MQRVSSGIMLFIARGCQLTTINRPYAEGVIRHQVAVVIFPRLCVAQLRFVRGSASMCSVQRAFRIFQLGGRSSASCSVGVSRQRAAEVGLHGAASTVGAIAITRAKRLSETVVACVACSAQ